MRILISIILDKIYLRIMNFMQRYSYIFWTILFLNRYNFLEKESESNMHFIKNVFYKFLNIQDLNVLWK